MELLLWMSREAQRPTGTVELTPEERRKCDAQQEFYEDLRRWSFLRCVDDRVVAIRLETQQIEALLYVRRQRRGDVDGPSGPRMRDHDSASEQMEPLLEAARQLPVLDVEIFRISDDRVADMSCVGAQLMGATRDRLEGQPAELLRRRVHDRVVGERMARALLPVRRDPHAGLSLPTLLLGEIGGDAPLSNPRHAGDQGPIDLAGGSRPEGLRHRRCREAGLGDHEAARGVLVEPMNEPGFLAFVVAQRIEKAVHMAPRS